MLTNRERQQELRQKLDEAKGSKNHKRFRRILARYCQIKRTYGTLRAAEQARIHFKKKKGTVLKPYKCQPCGKYHLTSKIKT